MISNISRQLNDIQQQGQHLLSGKPTDEQLDAFCGYNVEMRSFLLSKIDDVEILELVHSIPDIDDVVVDRINLNGLLQLVLIVFTIGISSLYFYFLMNERKKIAMQQNIRLALSKYASIEFLLKARQSE
jgi:hypothetical protein